MIKLTITEKLRLMQGRNADLVTLLNALETVISNATELNIDFDTYNAFKDLSDRICETLDEQPERLIQSTRIELLNIILAAQGKDAFEIANSTANMLYQRGIWL